MLPTRFSHLSALKSQKVGGVDVKLRDNRGRWGGHAQPQVDGFGTAECGVVSQGLEGNYGVLRKERLLSHAQIQLAATQCLITCVVP